MSTREDRLASAAQFEEWLKSPGQNTLKRHYLQSEVSLRYLTTCKQFDKRGKGVGSALGQFDNLFGKVRILLQVSSDMQYELILIL